MFPGRPLTSIHDQHACFGQDSFMLYATTGMLISVFAGRFHVPLVSRDSTCAIPSPPSPTAGMLASTVPLGRPPRSFEPLSCDGHDRRSPHHLRCFACVLRRV